MSLRSSIMGKETVPKADAAISLSLQLRATSGSFRCDRHELDARTLWEALRNGFVHR